MRSRLGLYLLMAALWVAPQLSAQQVTGTVTDERTGGPVAAVQVFIAGSGIGALTQQNGRFLLLNVPVGTHTVTAERIGYRSMTAQVTVAAGQTAVSNFQIAEAALGLDEIIVTGTPGGTQRRAIGNSVASLSASTVTETVIATDMKDMLRGRATGLTLSSAAGGIGQGQDITIRGGGSFDRARSVPIIFVDGVRINTDPAGAAMAQGNNRLSNPLEDFNTADIESIEIIKGPAAATLYGTEASAGVIQIITKRGSTGAPSFNASIVQGTIFNRTPEEKMGVQWACTDAFAIPCTGGASKVVPYSLGHLLNMALADGGYNVEWNHEQWPQQNLWQYGHSYSYNLDVRGGTDRIRYFLSANKDRDEGPVYFNWDGATRVRGNVGVIFSDAFTLDMSMGFVSGKTSYATQVATRGGTWDQLTWGQGYCAPDVAIPANPSCRRTLGLQQFLPTDQAKISSTRDYDRFTGSATLNFTSGDWFSSRAIIGLDKGWDTNEWVHPIHDQSIQSNVIQATLEGEVLNEKPSNTVLTLDWSSTINKPIAQFTTATSFGAQFYYDQNENLSVFGQGLASPLSTTVNQTPVTRSRVIYEYTENKSMGFYAQEMVGWNDRVFVTGALRFDDNSTFGSNFDPIIYPKLSATWVVSEESFWGFDFLDELRVRGAWGKAGRQPNTLAGVNTFLAWNGPGGTSAIDPSTAGNPDVGPERSTELELGFDVSALEGRISGEFNWYNRTNEDNLLGVALPPSVGSAATIQRNLGTLKNWGWEASLNTRPFEGDRISFNLDFNASYKMNEITDIGDFPGNNTVKIGFPYPNNRSVEFWVTRAEYSPTSTSTIVDAAGRRIQAYCDKGILLDPDQSVDPRRSRYGVLKGGEEVPCQQVGGYRINAGPGFIPWTIAINPTVSIADVLQIRAMFDGAYGSIGQDGTKLWHHRYNTSYGAVTMTDPRYVAGYRLDRQAQMAFYDKDYWKLREIGVRYSLPSSWVSSVGGDRASLTLSAREIATLWTANEGTGIYPSMEDLGHPETTIFDVDYGRSADGDGGCRADPPVSTIQVRLDVSFE